MDTSVSAAPAIVSAIARRAADGALDGLTVQTILDAYPFEFYADESLRGKMTGLSWFSSGGARRAINGGWADILPAYYRDIPKLIRENYEYDVVLLSVSPMDKHGYFSLATANSYTEALLDRTKRVFLEVNSFQPRAICGGQVHISRVDDRQSHRRADTRRCLHPARHRRNTRRDGHGAQIQTRSRHPHRAFHRLHGRAYRVRRGK